MISTANYEARKYGVRAAMPGFIAVKLCPHLKFIKLDFQKYQAAAAQARAVFSKFDASYCSRGLDEASLCITQYCATACLSATQVLSLCMCLFKPEPLVIHLHIAFKHLLNVDCAGSRTAKD